MKIEEFKKLSMGEYLAMVTSEKRLLMTDHKIESHPGFGGFGVYYICNECGTMYFISPNGHIYYNRKFGYGAGWNPWNNRISCREVVVKEIIE